jgi:prevent-host-death family protein
MKVVTVRQARSELSDVIAQAQKKPVFVTNHGRPVAMVLGIEGKDLETVLLENDPSFWRELDRRTKEDVPGVSLEEFRAGKRTSTKKSPRSPSKPRRRRLAR